MSRFWEKRWYEGASDLLEAPRNARPRRWYFDTTTGLLLRIEEWNAKGKLERAEDYDDYREVDGIKIPFAIGITDEDIYAYNWDFTYSLRLQNRFGVISTKRMDPMFWGDDARAATDRGKNMGFRCVLDLPGQKPPQVAFAEVRRTYRDFSAEKPLSDDAFQVVRGYYAYDKAKPLKAVVEGREETASWVHERAAVDAGYGSERLIVHLFLPHEAAKSAS